MNAGNPDIRTPRKGKDMTCIVCPVGCRIHVDPTGEGAFKISGNACQRGHDYAMQESRCPVRMLTSLVRVRGGERPVCACKTAKAVPKGTLEACLKELHGMRVQAPIRAGDVLREDIAGTGVALVATANCRSMGQARNYSIPS